jgi:repressor LexA
MNEQLTGRQQEVLNHLVDVMRREGRAPTVREIAAHFRIASPKGVSDHLAALERKGYLQRDPGRARNIRLTRSPDAIPIVGDVAAGAPILAEQHITGAVDFSDLFGRGEVFAVRVKGDSMRDAGIMEGDLVIVQKDAPVANGAIGVAYVDGEATVKRIRRQASAIILQPENPAYQPLQVDATTPGFALAGPVVGVVRRMRA